MTLRRNLSAGLANTALSAVISLAVAPLYVRYLGVAAYGLIGIFVSVQTLVSLLDLGMNPSISREVARGRAAGNPKPARELLHSFAVIYWAVAVGLVALAGLIAEPLASHWAAADQTLAGSLATTVALGGIAVACRWPANLYSGVLIGAEQVTLLSGVSIAWSVLNGLGGVAMLAWVAPRVDVLFAWQAVTGLAYAIAMHRAAWHALGRESTSRFSMQALQSVWHFSATLAGLATAALLLNQLDRIMLSSLLTLERFGQYALAGLIASGLNLFTGPTFNVACPRFATLVAQGETRELETLYRASTRLFAASVFPLAMILAVFGREIVQLWTGNASLGGSVAPVLTLLAVGAALNGVTYLPYALHLAYGITRLTLRITLALLLVVIPMMGVLTWKYGVIGGAAAWLLLHVFQLLLTAWRTHDVVLKGIGRRWIGSDIGVPFIICAVAALVARWLLSFGQWPGLAMTAFGALLLIFCWSLAIATAPAFARAQMANLLRPVLPFVARFLDLPAAPSHEQATDEGESGSGRRSRLLIVTGSFPALPCGVGDYSERLALELARSSTLDVEVLTTATSLVVRDLEGVTVWPVMEHWGLGQLFFVFRFIRSRQPDIVHVQHPTQGYGRGWLPGLLPLIAWLGGARVVQTWHEGFGRAALLSVAWRCVVPGPLIYVRHDLNDRFGALVREVLKLKKHHIIGNAAVIPRAVVGEQEAVHIRASFGATHDLRLIVFFGFLYRHKGVDLLFDIADPQSDRIVIAGDGSVDPAFHHELTARANEPDWRGKVAFLGFVQPAEAARLLAIADAAVLPFREGAGDWNTSIHGAVLNGCPVITTSMTRRGTDESLGINYSSVGDVPAMRMALQNCRRKATSYLQRDDSWSAITQSHLKIYADHRRMPLKPAV